MNYEQSYNLNLINFFKKKVIFLILLLLIGGPKIKGFLDLTLVSAGIFIIFSLKRILLNRKINSVDLYFYLTNIILLFAYSFLKFKEISYPEYFLPQSKELLKVIFYNFACYGVIIIYKNLYKDYYSKLSYDLINCVIIISSSVIIFLIFPDLRNFLYSKVDLYILHGRVETFQYRVTDLSIGGSTISIIFAYFYFFIDFYYKEYFSLKTITYKLILLFAIFITARTGIYLILILYFLNFICLNKIFRFKYNPIYLLKLLILCLIAIILIYILLINNQRISDQFLYMIVPWVYEAFSSGVDNFTNDKSLEFIINQFKLLPSSYIFGSNVVYLAQNQMEQIDSRLLNIWHFGGILVLTLTFVWFFLSFFILFAKKIKLNQFKILLVFVIMIILGNLKDSFLGSARGGIVLFLLINYLFLSSHIVNKFKINK